jgi:TonB family protein
MFRLLLVIAIGAISNLVAADLSGKWTGTMETNGSRVPVHLTLNQHGQELSGTVAAGDDVKPESIENPAIHGDELTFDVHDNANRIVTFRLTHTNFVLTGEASAGGQVSRVSLSTPAKGGVFRVGGGVSAPSLIHKVEPEYTEEARAAKHQGTVLLYVEIDPNGNATNIKLQRSLGLGLDEKAIEAVRQWKFKPGYKGDQPVTVVATIEVNFRL